MQKHKLQDISPNSVPINFTLFSQIEREKEPTNDNEKVHPHEWL
jgi:hypothetical protein